MNIINLIEQVLKDNIFRIEFDNLDNDNIIKNLSKVGLVTGILGITVNKEILKISLFVMSVVIILYTMEKFVKVKNKTDVNNKFGNYRVGNDANLKEIKDKNKFFDTIHLHNNDLVNKNINIRNFYRLPNPRRLNNQKQFGKWLYYKKKTCKEDNSKCFKHEVLNNR